ncbi:MAG: DUF2235 domain-containing protein [Magnetococcales bacterium]|nr:DUF2235 domain-containing protein [Magnetococcales bacterium]
MGEIMGKKIILCFDGTSNDPQDARQRKNIKLALKDGSVSNIFKLHILLGGSVNRTGESFFDDQTSYYYQGVGTYGNKLQQWFNAGLALPNMDVSTIINRAADDLAGSDLKAGDSVYLFGFSRGAAIARRFASAVNDLLRKRDPKANLIEIRFLAVFDTVASIGFPNLDDDNKPISDVVFENCKVADCVKEAVHMVALDEKRTAFMPTLMSHEQKVTEIWFAGAHSDIGGGYRYDGLADITLQFILDEITQREIGLRYRSPEQFDCGTEDCRKLGLAYDDMAIHPNPLGKSHEQDRSWFLEWTLTDRDLRTHTDDPKQRERMPPPLLHYTVLQRIHGDPDYRPVSLSKSSLNGQIKNQITHCIWRPDGAPPEVAKGLEEHLKKGPPAAKKLNVGDSRLVTVYANQLYNRSYIYTNEQESYSFMVKESQHWFDSGIICGADGWDRDSEDFPWYQALPIKFMENERRHPNANWFELVGVVGKKGNKTPFYVLPTRNQGQPLKIENETGELYFFANDLEDRYDNNLGFIQVEVTRVG